MTEEITLPHIQAQRIQERLRDAVHTAERNQLDMEPAPFVRSLITGDRHLVPLAVGIGIVSGLISLVVWNWIYGWLGLQSILADFGAPVLLAEQLPTILAFWTAAGSAVTPIVNESREARYRLLTEGQNAHSRAAVLYAAIEQLDDILPNTVPDLYEYSHDGRDGAPNPLVERAIGRIDPTRTKTSKGRNEPRISR